MDEKTGFQSQMKLLDSPNPVYEKSCCKNKKSEDSSTENLKVMALTDMPASENFAWGLSIVEITYFPPSLFHNRQADCTIFASDLIRQSNNF